MASINIIDEQSFNNVADTRQIYDFSFVLIISN